MINKQNAHLLRLLAEAKNKILQNVRKTILQNSGSELIRSICECSYTVWQ